MGETREIHAKGIRIVPGQWRPHCPYEQIAWVSPPWPSQDYVWLDFPEAVFTTTGLHYLSHVNPAVPSLFHDLPRVPWQNEEGGISFKRTLPNDARFGGWQSYLQRSEDFINFCAHMHIWEMLSARGGAGKTRVVWRWPTIR